MSMTATESNPQDHSVSPKGMLIGGQWVESASGARITVENPAKRKPIAEVPRGNAADVERAVAAATKAYAEWRKVPPRERGKALLKIAEALQARAEEIARTISLETGNALRTQARGEASMTADIFRYFGGLGSELEGRDHPARRERAVLHPPRAAGRGRRHHPVERAGHAGRAQDRAGAVRRQHDGA